MADDAVLFEERHVRVTAAKVVIGTATYPVSGITSVRRSMGKGSPAGLILSAGGGFMLAGLVMVGAVTASRPAVDKFDVDHPLARTLKPEQEPNQLIILTGAVLSGGLFLGALVAGAAFSARAPKTWVLTIGTAGGDRRALASEDAELVDSTRAAIERAITERG